MKLLSAIILTASLSLGACATVEMVPGQASQESAAVIDSVDRLALRRSAKALAYNFAQNGWIEKKSGTAQTAAGVLLRGLKPKTQTASAQDIYAANAPSVMLVKSDISAASLQVRSLADMAVTVLSADPDAKALSKDLRALEKALLAARKSEMTFGAALSAKGVADTKADTLGLSQSTDALRAVTDSIAQQTRGNAPSAPSS